MRPFSRLGFEDFGGDRVTRCGGLYRRRNLAEGQGFVEVLLGTTSVIKPVLCLTREGHGLRLGKKKKRKGPGGPVLCGNGPRRPGLAARALAVSWAAARLARPKLFFYLFLFFSFSENCFMYNF